MDFTKNSVEVETIIKEVGFLSTITYIKLFVYEIVREFWIHLPVVKVEEYSVTVWVRGHEYEFFDVRINALFNLPNVDHQVVVAKVSSADLARFMTGGKIKSFGGITSTTQYTAEKNEVLKICCLNWYPTKNSGYRNAIQFMIMHTRFFSILENLCLIMCCIWLSLMSPNSACFSQA